MKPQIEAYKILKLEQTFFVLDPYDLFTMPALKIIGPGYRCPIIAEEQKKAKFESDIKEYERLKAMGRGFPDND